MSSSAVWQVAHQAIQLCQTVGPWTGGRRGRWLHCCFTADRIASTWEGDLRQEALAWLALSYCGTAGLYLNKKA